MPGLGHSAEAGPGGQQQESLWLPTPRGQHGVDLAFCMDAADPVSGCPRCFERQATRPLIQPGQERGPGYTAPILGWPRALRGSSGSRRSGF